MRNLLISAFAATITSKTWFSAQRFIGRRRRPKTGRPVVEWFHRLDDAHSVLLGCALEDVMNQCDVDFIGRTVAPTPDHLAPQAELLRAYAAQDAQQIAPHLGLEIGPTPPTAEAVAHAHALLADAEGTTDYLKLANDVGALLWAGALSGGTETPNAETLKTNRRRLEKLGHYQSGMLYFEGEWYFGVDRLNLLTTRLNREHLGARPEQFFTVMPSPPRPDEVEFFYSARSPYSYLALRRALDICEAANVPVRMRPVLPMVMRGEPVPRTKRVYLLRDAAREAHKHKIPFGWVSDPVGPGVERVLAVFLAARAEGLPANEFLECAGQAIWSRGTTVATDRGLKRVCAAAGIPWELAHTAVQSDAWRHEIEDNQRALRELGHWGVPTFRVGDHVLWGQDRLWLLEWLLSG